MDKKELFIRFFIEIEDNKLLTKFINDIFGYRILHDFNYIYRMIDDDDRVIIDIYDNVSRNRFNRYIFNFDIGKYDKRIIDEDDVIVTYINVFSYKDSNKLFDKFIYLFNVDNILEYANSFLDKEYIDILTKLIK